MFQDLTIQTNPIYIKSVLFGHHIPGSKMHHLTNLIILDPNVSEIKKKMEDELQIIIKRKSL